MVELADDRDQQSAFPPRFLHGMAEVGKVEHRNPKEFEDGVLGGGLVVGDGDGVRDQLPVGLGEAAVGHGAVDDLVAAFSGLQQDAAGEQKWIGRGVHDGASGAPDSQ